MHDIKVDIKVVLIILLIEFTFWWPRVANIYCISWSLWLSSEDNEHTFSAFSLTHNACKVGTTQIKGHILYRKWKILPIEYINVWQICVIIDRVVDAPARGQVTPLEITLESDGFTFQYCHISRFSDKGNCAYDILKYAHDFRSLITYLRTYLETDI